MFSRACVSIIVTAQLLLTRVSIRPWTQPGSWEESGSWISLRTLNFFPNDKKKPSVAARWAQSATNKLNRYQRFKSRLGWCLESSRGSRLMGATWDLQLHTKWFRLTCFSQHSHWISRSAVWSQQGRATPTPSSTFCSKWLLSYGEEEENNCSSSPWWREQRSTSWYAGWWARLSKGWWGRVA